MLNRSEHSLRVESHFELQILDDGSDNCLFYLIVKGNDPYENSRSLAV